MKIAVIGATGAVGREMVIDLDESTIGDIELGLFASPKSAGEVMLFRGKSHEVKPFQLQLLQGYDYCLMSAGGTFSRQHARQIADLGVTVIDNSSAWRMTDGVPLIVPEVNGTNLSGVERGSIISNPNCSTIQLIVALKPLLDNYGIENLSVATYQSVSGTGQRGIAELSNQVESVMRFGEPKPSVYAQPIVFNVLPAIDVLDSAGHCFEEEKMIRETRKILNQPTLSIFATTVRVPVYHCHCEAVTVKLSREVRRDEVVSVFKDSPGIKVYEENDHASLPTPKLVTGDKRVHLARIRTEFGVEKSRTVQFWVVADNLKKGAATNAVQILEMMSHT